MPALERRTIWRDRSPERERRTFSEERHRLTQRHIDFPGVINASFLQDHRDRIRRHSPNREFEERRLVRKISPSSGLGLRVKLENSSGGFGRDGMPADVQRGFFDELRTRELKSFATPQYQTESFGEGQLAGYRGPMHTAGAPNAELYVDKNRVNLSAAEWRIDDLLNASTLTAESIQNAQNCIVNDSSLTPHQVSRARELLKELLMTITPKTDYAPAGEQNSVSNMESRSYNRGYPNEGNNYAPPHNGMASPKYADERRLPYSEDWRGNVEESLASYMKERHRGYGDQRGNSFGDTGSLHGAKNLPQNVTSGAGHGSFGIEGSDMLAWRPPVPNEYFSTTVTSQSQLIAELPGLGGFGGHRPLHSPDLRKGSSGTAKFTSLPFDDRRSKRVDTKESHHSHSGTSSTRRHIIDDRREHSRKRRSRSRSPVRRVEPLRRSPRHVAGRDIDVVKRKERSPGRVRHELPKPPPLSQSYYRTFPKKH